MEENGFKYVDLGLPSGTMWATCNVGADKPEDPGLLFQFGRVDGYAYGDKNHKFRTNQQNLEDIGNEYIPITTSAKVYNSGDTLDLEDDAAHVNMEGRWRMPTKVELEELIKYTTKKPTIFNNTEGIMFVSKFNSNYIFIPCSNEYWFGKRFISKPSNVYPILYMWASQVDIAYEDEAVVMCCCFDSSGEYYKIDSNSRSNAFLVRGVFKK